MDEKESSEETLKRIREDGNNLLDELEDLMEDLKMTGHQFMRLGTLIEQFREAIADPDSGQPKAQ